MTIGNRERFAAALARFDAAAAEDPRTEIVNGQPVPKELLYGRRMSRRLATLAPDAPEAVQLAARSQHIRRWEIPRENYPVGREGYNCWRRALYRFHAQTAAQILHEVGYGADTVERVSELLQKKRLKLDPEMQLLEDVICLVFLECYFADFSQRHDPDKVAEIVRKTWRKMSPQGHAAAMELDLSPDAASLVQRALNNERPIINEQSVSRP